MRLTICTICLIILACHSCVAKAELPITKLAAESAAFDTAEQAALAGLQAAKSVSEEFEAGGLVLKCDADFLFTVPVSSNMTHHVEFQARVPKSCTIAAMFHTHPAKHGDLARFSDSDVKMVRSTNVPSYIAVDVDSNVRVLTPKDAAPSYQERKSGEVKPLDGRVVKQ